MDINNYSYTNNFLPNDIEDEFENDDISIRIFNNRSYDKIFYDVDGYSYDGSLEIYERFNDLETAKKLFDFVCNNYSSTPPLDDNEELNNFIKTLKTA